VKEKKKEKKKKGFSCIEEKEKGGVVTPLTHWKRTRKKTRKRFFCGRKGKKGKAGGLQGKEGGEVPNHITGKKKNIEGLQQIKDGNKMNLAYLINYRKKKGKKMEIRTAGQGRGGQGGRPERRKETGHVASHHKEC